MKYYGEKKLCFYYGPLKNDRVNLHKQQEHMKNSKSKL